MPQQHRELEAEDARAVSPVIGVILMVAISVILAAVVGAFVLEVGDRQETAPQASFDSGERTINMKSLRGGNLRGYSAPLQGNTSQVYLEHAGGETLYVSQTELKVEGHEDVMGIFPHYNDLAQSAGSIDDAVDLGPQPDYRQTLGTNQPATIASGESVNVIAYNFEVDANGPAFQRPTGEDDQKYPISKGTDYILIGMFKSRPSYGYQATGSTLIDVWTDESTNGGWGSEHAQGVQLGKGDEVELVWQSESGGKTQTLFKYTTQHPATGEVFTTP